MRFALALVTGLALAPAAAETQAAVQRGTIAVLPFGAASPEFLQTAAAVGVAVENALMESQRFTAVLPRAGDAAVRAEITKTTEPTNIGSIVQIAQDAQLNANYVLSGWVIGQDVKSSGTPTGGFTAQVRALIRILDVSTGSMVMSDIVTIKSGPALNCPGGLPGRACQLGREMHGYGTQEEAVTSTRTNGNAQAEIQKSLTENLGYIVVDLTEGEDGARIVLRAVNGEPKRGTKLRMVHSRTSSLDPNRVYTTTIGTLAVVEVSNEVAIATITDGAEKIVKALKDRQPILVLK
jgi:hypothetical protein